MRRMERVHVKTTTTAFFASRSPAIDQAIDTNEIMNTDQQPPQILEVYGSRLCFYCDSQTDPNMQDQVAEVMEPRSQKGRCACSSSQITCHYCGVLGRPWTSCDISISVCVFAIFDRLIGGNTTCRLDYLFFVCLSVWAFLREVRVEVPLEWGPSLF